MVKTLIDSAAGLVIHTTTGDMSVEEIETAIEARLESPEFRPGMKVLWDFRGAAISSLTTQGVQDLLAFNIQKAGARGGGKSAMVAIGGRCLWHSKDVRGLRAGPTVAHHGVSRSRKRNAMAQ